MSAENSSSEDEALAIKPKRLPIARKSPGSNSPAQRLKQSKDIVSARLSPTTSARSSARAEPIPDLEARISSYLNLSINRMVSLFVSDLRTILDTDHTFTAVLESFRSDLLSNVKSIVRFPEERVLSSIDVDVFDFAKEFRKAESGIRQMKEKSYCSSLDSSLETVRNMLQNVSSVSSPTKPSEATPPKVRTFSRRKEVYELEQKRILIDGRFAAMSKQKQWLDEEIKHMRSLRKMREEAHEDGEEMGNSVAELKRNVREMRQTIMDLRWKEHDDMSTVCDNLYSASVDMCDGFVGAYQMRVNQRRENRLAQMREEQQALDLAQARRVRSAVFA